MVEEEKIDEVRQSEEDNFDFSMYEEDQKENEENKSVESLKDLKRPTVTGLRSRFSLGEKSMDRIAMLCMKSSEYSIEVSSRTQDIRILRKYYGILDELWECIRNIFGSVVNDEMNDIKKRCLSLLNHFSTTSNIPPKVHHNLLFFRSQIYRLQQLTNLNIEVDRTSGGIWGKAKKTIKQ